MHISGKIFAWMVVALGAASIYMGAKTLGIRQAWMERAQKDERDFNESREAALKAHLEYDQKRNEYVRAILGWDRYFNGVEAAIDQNGQLAVQGIGAAVGLKNDDLLYVFALNQDGTDSTYVGCFRVAQAAENRVVAIPHWRLREGDLAPGKLPFGARVRTQVPTAHQARFATLDQQLLAVEQGLADALEEKQALAALAAQTEKLIDERQKELDGDPAFETKSVPDVNKLGLLAAIAKEEESRNQALLEADRLHRELLQVRQKLNDVLKSNRQRVAGNEGEPGEVPVARSGRN
jgi:hypothetical protein